MNTAYPSHSSLSGAARERSRAREREKARVSCSSHIASVLSTVFRMVAVPGPCPKAFLRGCMHPDGRCSRSGLRSRTYPAE